ncbi:hypothetical protein AB0992_19525, partial [Enterococcus raffinosus]
KESYLRCSYLTLSVLFDKEPKKYVIRERNKDNNREVFVKITDEASKALETCEQDYTHSKKRVILPLDEGETQTLLELLKKLVN